MKAHKTFAWLTVLFFSLTMMTGLKRKQGKGTPTQKAGQTSIHCGLTLLFPLFFREKIPRTAR